MTTPEQRQWLQLGSTVYFYAAPNVTHAVAYCVDDDAAKQIVSEHNAIRAAERESAERMREAAAQLADDSCAAKVAAAIRALPVEE